MRQAEKAAGFLDDIGEVGEAAAFPDHVEQIAMLAGEISYEDALRYADSQNEVRLRIKLAQGGDARTLAQGLDGVEIAEVR